MSKLYEVKKIEDGYYSYLVIANSYRSPLDVLDEISKEIECDNCTVLFDMLLRTGLSYNRYLSMDYLNNTFDIKSTNVVQNNITDYIKRNVIEVLNENIEYVEDSILPAPLKFLIKKKQLV
jgi:hypothetical protein